MLRTEIELKKTLWEIFVDKKEHFRKANVVAKLQQTRINVCSNVYPTMAANLIALHLGTCQDYSQQSHVKIQYVNLIVFNSNIFNTFRFPSNRNLCFLKLRKNVRS